MPRLDEKVSGMSREGMTPRERFKRVMNFRKADRLPWMEFQLDEAIVRWIKEGLPIEQVIRTRYDLDWDGAFQVVQPRPYTFDVSRYFAFDPILDPDTNVMLDVGPLPRYLLKTLQEDDDRVLCRNSLGVRMQYRKIDYSMPHFVDFPIKSLKDWEEYRKRLNPADPRRYPKDYTSEEYIEKFENSTLPTSLIVSGFYALVRELLGTAAAIPAFYKDPELIHDMMNSHADFLIEVYKDAVEGLKSRIDWVFWHEDLSCGSGPNISPRLFKEFILPNLKKVTSFFNKNGIDLIIIDTDGDPRALMPLFWEGGIRGIWPLEVTAGMDAVELRKQHGRTWRLLGNIDKRALAQGKEAIKREVDRKLPFLKEDGGYAVGLDHQFPSDVSLDNFTFYGNYVKNMARY
jgi:uroporphyrinogen-III decarboxylase